MALMACPECGKQINTVARQCKYCKWSNPAFARSDGAEIEFDVLGQVEMVRSILLPGEQIEAVYDMKGGGTGFLGITTKRLVIYDKVFMRKMKAVVSVPYSRVHSVAAKDESGLLTGRGWAASSTLVIALSDGEKEFEFRGAEKAHTAHALIVSHMIG